jgi:hypothetical protein
VRCHTQRAAAAGSEHERDQQNDEQDRDKGADSDVHAVPPFVKVDEALVPDRPRVNPLGVTVLPADPAIRVLISIHALAAQEP